MNLNAMTTVKLTDKAGGNHVYSMKVKDALDLAKTYYTRPTTCTFVTMPVPTNTGLLIVDVTAITSIFVGSGNLLQAEEMLEQVA